MVLRYAALGLVALVALFLIFSGSDWHLPGRDATIILVALAFGFYVLGVKLDDLRKNR
jgi:hypothetical protein